MATRQEIFDKITAALAKKVGNTKIRCTICGHDVWTVDQHFTSLPALDNPSEVKLGGSIYPFVTIYCHNCGNTHLINVRILGFTDPELLKFEDEPKR
jgi:hypothetical protein